MLNIIYKPWSYLKGLVSTLKLKFQLWLHRNFPAILRSYGTIVEFVVSLSRSVLNSVAPIRWITFQITQIEQLNELIWYFLDSLDSLSFHSLPSVTSSITRRAKDYPTDSWATHTSSVASVLNQAVSKCSVRCQVHMNQSRLCQVELPWFVPHPINIFCPTSWSLILFTPQEFTFLSLSFMHKIIFSNSFLRVRKIYFL